MGIFRNQKGFTGLEIILLVVVLAGVGFAGYTAYQSNTEQSAPQSSSETTRQEPATEEKSAETADEKAMFEAAKSFCLSNGGASCKTASVDKRKGNVASIKTESMLVLVAKDSSGQWKAILGNNSDSDICTTGSGAPQLRELCV